MLLEMPINFITLKEGIKTGRRERGVDAKVKSRGWCAKSCVRHTCRSSQNERRADSGMPRSNLGSSAATIFDEELKSAAFNVELEVAVCHVLSTFEG